jgi:exonuclease III
LNVNSLLKHIDEIQVILEKHPLDILAINESKIDDSISDNEINISGYALCQKDRNRNGGGVVLYIRDCFSFIEW